MELPIELVSWIGQHRENAPLLATRGCAGAVAVLSRAPKHAELLSAVAAACATLPALRRRTRPGARGTPQWIADRDFDLSHHLRWESVGADADLLELASKRLEEPLDQSRPPWELHVLAGPDRSVVLVKLARFTERTVGALPLLARLAAAVRGAPPDARGVRTPALMPSIATDPVASLAYSLGNVGETLAEALDSMQRSALHLRDSASQLLDAARTVTVSPTVLAQNAFQAVKDIGDSMAERLTGTDLSALLGSAPPSRHLILLDLAAGVLDQAREAVGLGLDEVLMSILSSALARVEQERTGARPEAMRVWVALPGRRETEVVLPLAEEDPLLRALGIQQRLETLRRGQPLRSRARAPLPEAPALLIAPARRRARRWDLSLSVDLSLLGARELAGATIERVYPLASPPGRAELAIGAHRMGDWLSLGLTCDRLRLPEPEVLVEAVRAASREFVAAAAKAPTRAPLGH